MTPLELKELLSEIKSEIQGITRAFTLINDGDITDIASEIYSDDTLIVGIIPDYGHKGKISGFRMIPTFELMILVKTDYSAVNNDDFVLLYERTLALITAVRDFILGKVEDGCYLMLQDFDIESMDIVPVRRKTDFNGWSLEILPS